MASVELVSEYVENVFFYVFCEVIIFRLEGGGGEEEGRFFSWGLFVVFVIRRGSRIREVWVYWGGAVRLFGYELVFLFGVEFFFGD